MVGALAVARQELARYRSLADRRLLVAMLVLGVVVGALAPVAHDRGVHPDRGLYTVDVREGSGLAAVVESDPALRLATEAERPDLVVRGDLVQWNPASERSQAAADRLQTAAETYMDEAMLAEEDQAAAFPVRVDLTFQPRDLSRVAADDANGTTSGGDGTEEANGTEDPASSPDSDEAPSVTGNRTNGTTQSGPVTPADVTPPFPMKSLVYTFAYLVPLTFVGELYGGSVFAERVKGRGRLLLAAPLSRTQLAVGKSLPYAGVTVAIAAGVSLLLGAGWTGFLASLPIIGFALAGAFLIGTLAPSQRALTFMLVSANVLLATFLFLPALFTEIPPIAYLSPVGLIAASIRGDAIGWLEMAYGTLPLATITGTLALAGASQFREETLFAPGSVAAKIVDGVEDLVTSRPRLLVAGALAVPLALALELFVLVFAVTLGLTAAFVTFLVGAALAEEGLKALVAYASAARPGGPGGSAWTVGGLVGGGFFLGEKALAGLGLLGFDLLPGGREAMATFGVAGGPLLVLAPLVLHVVGPTLVARAARGSPRRASLALAAATVIHAAYNALAVVLVGGGIAT